MAKLCAILHLGDEFVKAQGFFNSITRTALEGDPQALCYGFITNPKGRFAVEAMTDG